MDVEMKKEMLFLVPVMPNITGGGREMRAYAWVMHLCQSYSVHLAVTMEECKPPDSLRHNIATIHFIPPVIKDKWSKISGFLLFILKIKKIPPIPHTISSTRESLHNLTGAMAKVKIDYLLVFRAGMIETGIKLFESLEPRRLELDIDDIESSAQLSIAKLRFKNHHLFLGIRDFIRSRLFFLAEKVSLNKFESVYVCSTDDQISLGLKYKLKNIKVFPNRILFQENSSGDNHTNPVFFFVGSLGYFPNEDAILFLLKHILPGLKKEMNKQFEIVIAGRSVPYYLKRLIENSDRIKYLGEVDNIIELYQNADIAIIPLRAGGGTKIKVLEAFLYKKPVIASKEAVSGLNVTNGEEYILASSEEDFISACCKLSNDLHLQDKLRNNAYHWLLNNHVFYNQ